MDAPGTWVTPVFCKKHGGGVVHVDRVVLGSMDREVWRFSGVERVDGFLVLAINTEAGLSRWAGLAWVCRTVWVEGLSEEWDARLVRLDSAASH